MCIVSRVFLVADNNNIFCGKVKILQFEDFMSICLFRKGPVKKGLKLKTPITPGVKFWFHVTIPTLVFSTVFKKEGKGL